MGLPMNAPCAAPPHMASAAKGIARMRTGSSGSRMADWRTSPIFAPISSSSSMPIRSLAVLLALLTVQVATAQFNQKGTVHLSIGIAGGAHNTQTKQTLHIFGVDLSKTTDSHAATVTFPIQVGVGLADFFSLGAFLEPGSYLDSSVTHSNSIVLYGVEPRFYLVNKEHFAWLAGLQLGGSTLHITGSQGRDKTDARYSGSAFGLSTGVVFQFTDLIGLQLHLRYMAANMPLRQYSVNGNSVSQKDFDAVLHTNGVALQASLGFRF